VQQLVDALPRDFVVAGGVGDAHAGIADLVDDDVVSGHVIVSSMTRLTGQGMSVNDVRTHVSNM